MNPYPSMVECPGMYNVNPEEYRGDELDAENDRTIYVQSVLNLPILTWSEFQDAQIAVYRTLERHGRLPGWDEEAAHDFYRYCVGDELTDRTLRVELPDLQVLTVSLIEHLQREVLETRPLWRIMILSEAPETSILIYPQIVRMGNLSSEADWKTALPSLIAQELALSEHREGPIRRQLIYLRERIPGELATLRDVPCRVVATFDNWQGDFGSLSVWILYRGIPGDQSWFDFDVERRNGISGSKRYAVRPDGSFGDEYNPDFSELWLGQWILPAGFSGNVIMRKQRAHSVIEGQWNLTIDRAAVIKDSDLKKHTLR